MPVLVSLAFALAGIHVGAHRVLPFGYAPAWSPNGARVAFVTRGDLWVADDGTTLLRDHKTGFWLADHYGIAPGNWPGRTPVFLGNCQQYNPNARSVLEGTSLGYTDRYPAFYHGQNVSITRLPAGIYDLVHRVNETMAIHELRYENDAASVRIRISWHKGVPGVTVLRRCQSTTTC